MNAKLVDLERGMREVFGRMVAAQFDDAEFKKASLAMWDEIIERPKYIAAIWRAWGGPSS